MMDRLGPKVLMASTSVLLLLAVSCGIVVMELQLLDKATGYVMRDYGRALLDGEFYGSLTRATGEAASYIQSGNEEYRREANEALERANHAVTALRELAPGGEAQAEGRFHALQFERQQSLYRLTESELRSATAAMSEGRGTATAALLRQVYASEAEADRLWREAVSYHQRERAENQADLNERSRRVRMWVLASTAVMALWLGLLVVYVRLRIVRPLAALAGPISSVASGSLTPNVEVTQRDEIGQLQRGFNRMVVELASQRSQLSELVGNLSQARDVAEAASRAKSDFLAHVSHEIRTPMNGVLATLDLMHETAPNLEQRDLADLARSSARNLLWMVDDLLDFACIEAGRLELRSVSFGLRELVTRLVELHGRRGDKKGLAVTCELADDLPHSVRGDSVRLGQILQNLIDNAIKYTEQGSINVAVTLEARASEQSTLGVAAGPAPIWLRLRVTDTGIGIPEQSRQAIFRPFEQAAAGYSLRQGGIGLGLSIAHRLTHLMNGQLEFESEVGKGSSFWFTVRLLPDLPSLTGEPTPVHALPFGCRVLVAEDNQTTREVLTRMLQRRGVRVSAVENGSHALALASSDSFDLILMDCQMPGLDGFEATRAIRSLDGARAEVPILALTAYGLVEDKQRFVAAGFSGVLTKPYTVQEIEDALRRWIGPARRVS